MQKRPHASEAEIRALALLLPGHNEELIIETTIASALAAGQNIEDIYVVDDASTDHTSQKALNLLPKENVVRVRRSGKAVAVQKAIKRFNLTRRYTWLHVADADSVFCPHYFEIYRAGLDSKRYAAAVGFVQSMRGNWIACYRCFNYTYGQHIFRRVQGWFNMISVLPGPVTCFRTDIIDQLDFRSGSLTEDFDLTLQIHRKKIGRIRFIPEAVNFTQDPRTLQDFCKQTARWQRGFFQGVQRHHICRRAQRIDVSVSYQMIETLFYLVQVLVVIPYFVFILHNTNYLQMLVAGDAIILLTLAIASALAARRLSVLYALPYYYPLRLLELGIFVWAFVEVIILHRYTSQQERGWATEGRRYQLNSKALRDTAR
ncbi:MAG TPA: glycosyltransferase family 2 protein [Candidatus Saccharimonadales bacterium]